ncbi:hypothetical protein ACFWDA_17040 [Rhodococcus zopfii]
MKPTRHELLDALAAMTDDELRNTVAEARAVEDSMRDAVRHLFGNNEEN